MSSVDLLRGGPVISYTSLDFAAIRADLISFAQATFSDRWTDFNANQFAVVFLELLTYEGDLLTFMLNAFTREGFPSVVQRRQNFLTYTKAFDFQPDSASAATGSLVTTSNPGDLPYTIPGTTQFSNGGSPDEVIFSPLTDQLITVTPQTINITEGEPISTQLIGTSDGTANQRFTLPNSPLIDTATDRSLEIRVNGVLWTRVSNAVDSGPTEEEYLSETDDLDVTTIIFGDGEHGKIPPVTQEVRATYRVGGGRRGVLNNGSIETIKTAVTGLLSVTNTVATGGGEDRPSLSTLKLQFPASLSTLERAVTTEDHADVALTVAGVAKASAKQGATGTKIIDLHVAPSGGGVPSAVLRNQIIVALESKRMVATIVRILDPVYKDLEVTLKVYVLATFEKDAVETVVRESLLTSVSTDVQDGLLDFDNVNFEALSSTGAPQVTTTRLQDLFDSLGSQGVQKVLLQRLTVKPAARIVDSNTGDGTVGAISFTNDALRREWRIVLTGATSFNVFERIIGKSTALADDTLTDDRAAFPTLPVGTVINPNERQGVTVAVDEASSTGTTIARDLADPTGFFGIAATGDAYSVQLPVDGSSPGTVGAVYTTADGTLTFTVTAGGTPFVNGDEFLLDIFPEVDDVVLREDEIPQLLVANLITNMVSAVG